VATALRYELVVTRGSKERAHRYLTESELSPGDVVVLEGRPMLVERIESAQDSPARAFAKPARYRLLLRHPDGRVEAGALRRHRPDAPSVGHAFSTLEDGHAVSWVVVDRRLARDEGGEPYAELIAERDFSELEEVPDHELEHALARRDSEDLPEAVEDTFARAAQAGLAVELFALDPGEAPDWAEAQKYLEALVVDEIEDDLLELCGVNPDRDPRETWVDTVKDRLRSDLSRFRDDVDGDHDQIEEWDLRGGRIFASVGTFEDEADPDSGHGWMCRLADGGVLSAAGFARVRRAQL
jgi:hypothetical protein